MHQSPGARSSAGEFAPLWADEHRGWEEETEADREHFWARESGLVGRSSLEGDDTGPSRLHQILTPGPGLSSLKWVAQNYSSNCASKEPLAGAGV